MSKASTAYQIHYVGVGARLEIHGPHSPNIFNSHHPANVLTNLRMSPTLMEKTVTPGHQVCPRYCFAATRSRPRVLLFAEIIVRI